METYIIGIIRKNEETFFRKLISDEALPIEFTLTSCSPSCSENCKFKGGFDLKTWVFSRKDELRDLVHEKMVELR